MSDKTVSDKDVELSRVLQELAPQISAALDDINGTSTPFVLIAFGEVRAGYISNCTKEAAMAFVCDMAKSWSEGQVDPPTDKIVIN